MPTAVTVIMGAYNAQDYVGAALASIREQNMADFQVVVIDAGSTDATAEVVAECAADDSRFRLIQSPRRLTAPQARNRAMKEVDTELVATLDADDLMLPDRLHSQMDLVTAHPETVAVGGILRNIDPDGLPLAWRGTASTPSRPPLSRPLTPATIAYAMPLFCPFLASAGLYRTEALRKIGGFDELSPWADDYTTIWRLSQVGPLRQVGSHVGEYRRHPASLSARRRHSQNLEVALMRRDIAAAVTGRPPNVSSVLAWTTTLEHTHPDTVELARSEFVEYHEAFSAANPLTEDDRIWIEALFEDKLSALEGRGAAQDG